MLQSATLQFLLQLNDNNNKAWFDENRKAYEAAKKDFEQFIGGVLQACTPLIPELKGQHAKDCIFRIFRDVRFSKDKLPYKNNFGAGFGKGGKKVHEAGFYLHIQPGDNSFMGGGLWMPESPMLKVVRQEIDYNLEEFESILKAPAFKKYFKGLDTSDKLKKVPQGYTEDNPAIEYLKLKSFTTGSALSDQDLTSKNLTGKIADRVAAMKPLVDFLNRASE